MLQSLTANDIFLRKPAPGDGAAIHELIRRSPPLDCNSAYSYFLLCAHFAKTCVVVERDRRLVGFLSAYIRPDAPDTLFVWQVAVDESMRGEGLGRLMLSSLLARPECADIGWLEATVGPSNAASRALFAGYARDHGARVETETFLEASAFGDTEHEAETLLRVGPLSEAAAREERRYAYL